MLLCVASQAQVAIGDDVTLSANGTLSAGYSGDYGNQIESSHGLGFGATGALNGFFYNPNFLSFNINPYYNQSRANSDFASISNASGVALNTSIFAGSHTPGSVNYSANFNSSGNYGIPGINSLNTNGNNQTFGINWGAYFPGWPTLSVGYQQGNSNYYLYGTDENGASNFKSFNINSTYNLYGFNLYGGVTHGVSTGLIPEVLIGSQTATSNSDNTSYVVGAEHALPWSGTFNVNFNRTDLDSNYLGYAFNGDIDLITSSAAFHPTPKLSFSLSADYTDNLSGSLYEAIVPGASGSSLASASGAGTLQNQSSSTTASTGVTGVEDSSSSESSHAFDFIFNTSYSFAKNLQAIGEFDRRQQSYFGETFGSNLYSAGLIYTRPLAGGHVGASINLIDSTVDNSNQNGLGFNANVNYSRRFGAWTVATYFSYAQNVQTFLVTYNTSFYNFSGNVSRRFGNWYWSASAAGGHSLITDVPDSSSSNESFSTNFGRRRFGIGGAYSKADGNGLASGNGILPTPLPPIIPSNLLVLYGGTSYGVSASVEPVNRFSIAASYNKSKDNLSNLGVTSWNNYEQENAYMQYQFRQLGVNGGYARLVQGFSASPLPPANVSSFYIGVYRWFNFF